MVRQAVVAGSFYPDSEERLVQQLTSLVRTSTATDRDRVLGAVSPHAGYIYSGPVAGQLFSEIDVPGTVVLLAPNHTGLGAAFAACAEDWRTPLGEVQTDRDLLDGLRSEFPTLTDDHVAHAHEHSAEVQLPFIQFTNPDAKVVGIVLMSNDLNQLKELGHAIATAIRNTGSEALVLASSDMTHYEVQESAESKDKQAIGRILDLDPDGLWETVKTQRMSMCGVAPVTAMLVACKDLGATTAKLVKYATSGDVTGDYSQVVGYSAVTVK